MSLFLFEDEAPTSECCVDFLLQCFILITLKVDRFVWLSVDYKSHRYHLFHKKTFGLGHS